MLETNINRPVFGTTFYLLHLLHVLKKKLMKKKIFFKYFILYIYLFLYIY